MTCLHKIFIDKDTSPFDILKELSKIPLMENVILTFTFNIPEKLSYSIEYDDLLCFEATEIFQTIGRPRTFSTTWREKNGN